jgi:hypothetical protein
MEARPQDLHHSGRPWGATSVLALGSEMARDLTLTHPSAMVAEWGSQGQGVEEDEG